MPDKIKILYDTVSKNYNVGSFEDFQTKLQDDVKRKAFYDGVSSEFELGDFNTFSSKVKKKDISQPDFQFGSQTSPFGSKPSQTQVDTKVPSVLTEQGKVGYEQEIAKPKPKEKPILDFSAFKNVPSPRDAYYQDPTIAAREEKSKLKKLQADYEAGKVDRNTFTQDLNLVAASGVDMLGRMASTIPSGILDNAIQSFGNQPGGLSSMGIDAEVLGKIAEKNLGLPEEYNPLSPNNYLAETFRKRAELNQSLARKGYNGGITDALKLGEYKDAAKLLTLGFTESLPILLGLAATRGTGMSSTGSLISMGLGTQATTYQDLKSENPDIAKNILFLNATLTGIGEAGSEVTGTNLLYSQARKLFVRGQKEQAKEIVTKGIKEYLDYAFQKSFIGSAVLGDVSGEVSNQIWKNAADKWSGVRPDVDYLDGVGDAALISAFTTSTLAAGAKSLAAIVNPKTKDKVDETSLKISNLQKEADDPDMPPAARTVIVNQIGDLTESINEDLKQDNLQYNNLDDDQKRAIDDLSDKRDEIKLALNTATVSDETKQVLQKQLDDIDSQIESTLPTKPITAQPTQKDVVITPETSSNYANMTEDDKGNFVFFHVGGKGYDKIKPGTGASTVTSREEAAALSKVGGLGMYYTDPNQVERQSAEGAKYAVKIPKEKVYDFNTDKLNFIEEAKARHEAENPGKAFDINSQLAYVTKIAGENGFDMVVAQWNNMTRAQTTKELTPTDVQESEGNVIKKAFSEKYESNKQKGFEPVVPVSKSERLATLYDKINKIRNKEKRYDDLYKLYADSNKLEQDSITKLINESDLSQEIKDEYKDILESKEETRRSQQTKPKEDAVQKQTAGQVPVQPEATVGEKVEQGKPQPKVEGVTEEGKEVIIDKESIVKNSAKELERVKSANKESEDGATFNIDGTKYEGVGLVVPVTSLNTTINKINPQMLADFVEKNKNKIGDMDTVKFGIYKFPNSNQISIDLNIIASEKFKDQAIEFGRLAGQESLFDLETYENVKTGSDGKNPIDFTDTQFKEISKALKDGRIPDVFAGESKDLASKIRSLKINLGSGTAQSNIAGLPIALYNSVVETVALLVEAGSTISDAIDKAIKKYNLDKVEKFNKPELTKNIEKTSKPQKAKSVKDIDVNKIRMQDRPGNRVSKGLAVKTVGGEKIVEESDNLSIKYVKENAPKVFISNAEKLARYPIVSGVKKFGEIKTDQQAQEVYDIFIRQVADNLKYLTNNYNSELREISTLWYDGANILANGLSDQYGISVEQAAGIIAAMSPQKDWYMNVRLAELVMLAYKQDAVLTNEMIAKQVDIAKEGEKPFLKSLKKAKDELLKSRTKENIEKSIDAQNKYTSSKEKAAKVIEWLKGYIGKNIKSVPEEVQPYIIRLHNELNNTKDFNVLRPDGEIIEIAKTKDGENKKIAWGSYSEIGKAASIYNNGSQENITKSLGEMHKIRNFYNNIIDPMSKDGDVTIDTHAVAAALMQPLSGNSKQVGENFGTGTSNSSPLGIKGLYYAYSDAYDLAAKELGLLPRQVQSITWEAVRGLFTDVFKRNIAEVKKINDIWKDYENGKITIEQARTAIDKSAGGVKDPTWAKSVLQEPKDGFEQRSIREGDGVSGPAAIGKSSTVRVAVKSIRKLKIDLGKGTAQSNILGLPIALYNAAIETIALGLEAGLSINDAINKAIEKHKLLNVKAFDKNSFVSKIENATSQPVKLNESNVENAIELLDDIEDNKRKAERASSKRKAELDEKITEAQTELDKISEEAQIVKAINDNFDKIKKDLKEQGLLNVKC